MKHGKSVNAPNVGRGVSVAIKKIPATDSFLGLAHKNPNVPGVFAAGDICGPPWQMAKAVGEGCVAGIGAATYAKKMKKTE